MKFDEHQINLGRELNEFRDSGHAALKELDAMIAEYREIVDNFNALHPSSAYVSTYYLPGLQALKKYREWIDEEIERGAKELLRKNDFEVRQSTQDPQSVEMAQP